MSDTANTTEAAPETTLQEIESHFTAILAKLENFEHEATTEIKSGVESLIAKIKAL